MTTTSTFTGIDGEGHHPSSRVLRPPGGGGSNIFGDPYDPEKDVSNKELRQQRQQQQQNPQPQPPPQPEPQYQPVERAHKPQENTKRAYNPITGEEYPASQQNGKAEQNGKGDANPNQTRNSSRVLNPPGGKSSGIF